MLFEVAPRENSEAWGGMRIRGLAIAPIVCYPCRNSQRNQLCSIYVNSMLRANPVNHATEHICRGNLAGTRSVVRPVSASYNAGSLDDVENPEILPVLPWRIQTPRGQQFQYLVSKGSVYYHLIESAVQHHVTCLPPPPSEDKDDSENPPQDNEYEFNREYAALSRGFRALERQRTLEEIILLLAVHRLAKAGMVVSPSIQISTGSQQREWRGKVREVEGNVPPGATLTCVRGLHRILQPAVADASPWRGEFFHATQSHTWCEPGLRPSSASAPYFFSC
eukprot:jgi/Botrbrau1/13016/Bobra.0389s0013.1